MKRIRAVASRKGNAVTLANSPGAPVEIFKVVRVIQVELIKTEESDGDE